jgi:hypothetical protein
MVKLGEGEQGGGMRSWDFKTRRLQELAGPVERGVDGGASPKEKSNNAPLNAGLLR